MALFHEWQAQRQRRQQELRDRQKQVSQDLAVWRENRLDMSREMRQSLSDYCSQIRGQTAEFLTNCRDQRYQDSQRLMQALAEFVNNLAAETSQFLSNMTQERSMMAQEQTKTLQAFHHHLSRSVIQFVQECHDQRLDMKAELTEYLQQFVRQLSADVTAYLREVDAQQQQVAIELQQSFLAARQQRSQTMQALYDYFASLRLQRQEEIAILQAEMWRNVKEYRMNLFHQVWGDLPTSTQTKSAPTSPVTVSQSIPSPVAAPAAPKLKTLPQTPVKATPQTTPTTTSTTAPVVPAPPAAPPQPVAPPSQRAIANTMQQAVYAYLKQVKSARIKDIEEKLKINRIQAVDILKSLIEQGLITQNNREYIIV